MSIGAGNFSERANALADELDARGIVLVVVTKAGEGIAEFESAIAVDDLKLMDTIAEYIEGLAARLREDAREATVPEGVKPS